MVLDVVLLVDGFFVGLVARDFDAAFAGRFVLACLAVRLAVVFFGVAFVVAVFFVVMVSLLCAWVTSRQRTSLSDVTHTAMTCREQQVLCAKNLARRAHVAVVRLPQYATRATRFARVRRTVPTYRCTTLRTSRRQCAPWVARMVPFRRM